MKFFKRILHSQKPTKTVSNLVVYTVNKNVMYIVNIRKRKFSNNNVALLVTNKSTEADTCFENYTLEYRSV